MPETFVLESTGKVVIDHRARGWCILPYDGHPDGCPNFGTRDTCPPRAPKVEEEVNLAKDCYLVAVKFDLGTHQLRMQVLHPNWSVKQCRNLLYWQGGVKKVLRETCLRFLAGHKGMTFNLIPEAMGINVINTANNLGLKVERNPNKFVYKIALVYWKKEG